MYLTVERLAYWEDELVRAVAGRVERGREVMGESEQQGPAFKAPPHSGSMAQARGLEVELKPFSNV